MKQNYIDGFLRKSGCISLTADYVQHNYVTLYQKDLTCFKYNFLDIEYFKTNTFYSSKDVSTEEVERTSCLPDETQSSHMEASAADAGLGITLGSPGRGRSRFIPDTTYTGRAGAHLATTSGPGRRSWRGRGRGRSAEAPV